MVIFYHRSKSIDIKRLRDWGGDGQDNSSTILRYC